MNNNHTKMVMFDFDGVLVNTLEHSYKIHTIKNKNLTWEHFQDFSNGNFHDGVGKALEEGWFIPSDNFYKQYEEKLQELTVHKVLHYAIQILAQKYILTIVSSTNSSIINTFLEKEKLSSYFNDVLGADIHTSKIIKIKSLLEKYSILPDDVLFITDTLGDIKEGNECGVRSIGVLWGLHPHGTMRKGNPVAIIDDPLDLVPTIENVLK